MQFWLSVFLPLIGQTRNSLPSSMKYVTILSFWTLARSLLMLVFPST